MTEVYDLFHIPPQERMGTWDSYMKLNIQIETLLTRVWIRVDNVGGGRG